ncbi:MAG: chemotaxis protein CheX [Epsilonproteobacteria bacterium]|nr:chemotaxis protein CheX [Campylobacterota bacterium]
MAGNITRTIQGDKVYMRPQGFLDSDIASNLITPLDLKVFEDKKIQYVSIDLSRTVSANMNAIRFLNDITEKLYKKDITVCLFNANRYVLGVLQKIENCYFNYFETADIERLFCSDEFVDGKDIYICCVEDTQNKNMLIYNLVKKGYKPKVVDSKNEIESEDAIVIKDSFISKISSRVGAMVKNNMVFFFFDGFLDNDIENKFDIEYFRRNLLIGFKVFAFVMETVKGMNVHAIRFLSKLGVEAAEYGVLVAIIGLDKGVVKEELIHELEDVGYVFFGSEEEMINSEVYKEAMESNEAIFKKSKNITKDYVKVLPYFVNATISTVELMTGVKATKEPPNIKEVNIDTNRTDWIASSIGFYGDIEGALILIFTEKLSKRISKILLGIEFSSQEELVDMIGEFANIIVGNVKIELSKHDVNLNLTLPKVFDKMSDLQNIVMNKKGIEVKFYFEDEEFYFYLIRS